MIELTPISVSATAHQYLMALSEGVCPPQCAVSQNQPIVSLSAAYTNLVNPDGVTAQVTTKVTGTITWTPLGSNHAIVKQFSETFVDGFANASAPTGVTYTIGANPQIALRKYNCCSNFANGIVISVPITITPTFP